MADPVRKVSFNDFPAQWAAERAELLPRIEAVFAKGDFVGGGEIGRLEAKLAQHFGARHVVALNSGTDALLFGLVAMGVGRGDEVITPSNSFVASTAAIAHVGATPVFADVADDQNLDPDAVAAAITPRTKAIMPVHLTGRMAEMDPLVAIAERHGLKIIEDAAQAAGALYHGRAPGAFGAVGCFSTHPLKNLNAAGDGGFVTTDDDAIAKRITLLRSHGLATRDSVVEFGFASRMDTLQAAVLSYRLELLEGVVAKRNANAALYRELLDPALVYHPAPRANVRDAYHLFVIQTDHRDALQAHLAEQGIGSKIHYPVPIHRQPAAQRFASIQRSLPNTERQSDRILSIPINQHLTRDDIVHVAETINSFLRSRLSASGARAAE